MGETSNFYEKCSSLSKKGDEKSLRTLLQMGISGNKTARVALRKTRNKKLLKTLIDEYLDNIPSEYNAGIGQKYSEQAREYRKNYTELQKLEFELNNIDGDDVDLIKNIYNRYCDLLDSSSNHISFDYYETVHGSIGEYKSKKWRNVRCRYYYNVIWRFVLKICVIVLPVGLYWICGVL